MLTWETLPGTGGACKPFSYSLYGTTFCDGVDLKSVAGIVKRASRFLGEPKEINHP